MHARPSISTETMELPLASVFDCELAKCECYLDLRAHGETAVEIHLQISAVYIHLCQFG